MPKDWPQQNRLSISNLGTSALKVLMVGHVDIPNIFIWTICKRYNHLCKEGHPKRDSETVHLSSSSASYPCDIFLLHYIKKNLTDFSVSYRILICVLLGIGLPAESLFIPCPKTI